MQPILWGYSKHTHVVLLEKITLMESYGSDFNDHK